MLGHLTRAAITPAPRQDDLYHHTRHVATRTQRHEALPWLAMLPWLVRCKRALLIYTCLQPEFCRRGTTVATSSLFCFYFSTSAL